MWRPASLTGDAPGEPVFAWWEREDIGVRETLQETRVLPMGDGDGPAMSSSLQPMDLAFRPLGFVVMAAPGIWRRKETWS